MIDESLTPEQQLEAELARLTPEQRSQLEQQAAFAQAMTQPLLLPLAFGVQSLHDEAGGDPAVMVSFQTPAYSARIVLLRDQALALASQVRRAAQTGPALVTPPGAGKLIVPGR